MTTTKKDKTKIVRKPMLVNLTEEQRAWLEGEAVKTGDTKTAIIRQAIRKEMEKENG